MILRLATSAERVALLVLASLFAVFLSFSSIRDALAASATDLETQHGYERATQLEPGNAHYWYLLGRFSQYNLENPDAQRAIRAYRTALSFDPRSPDAWLDLAAAYDSEGDIAAATDAFLNAKKAYPASAEVAWRYGNFLLRQGHLDAAFLEIRHSVETEPRRGAEAFSRCVSVEPDVAKVLDRVIPPYRDVYLDIIRELSGESQFELAVKIWDRLAQIHPQLSLKDIFPFVDGLRQLNQVAEARRVWNQAVAFAGLSELPGTPGSVVWDGGFESGVTNGGFAWFISHNSRNVRIVFDSREKHSGNQSLHLTFDGKSNVNFEDVCQFVPVQPSTLYRFSAWTQTRMLTTDQGLRFRLRSIGTKDFSISVTPDVRGSESWKLIEMPWKTGKDLQQVQICLIRAPSTQDENKIQGTVWVDDVALTPESPRSSAP